MPAARRRYLYLHGFASSPRSCKAAWLAERLAAAGHELRVPDLNRDGFERMTLARQALVAREALGVEPGPVTLVGSSFGGLLAARLAEAEPRVDRLVLLAPAFRFGEIVRSALGPRALERWRQAGRLRLPAEFDSARRWLHYGLVEELLGLDPAAQCRTLEARLFHGIDDAVVPYRHSVDYLARNRHARLLLLPDDHGLTASLPAIWEALQPFLETG